MIKDFLIIIFGYTLVISGLVAIFCLITNNPRIYEFIAITLMCAVILFLYSIHAFLPKESNNG